MASSDETIDMTGEEALDALAKLGKKTAEIAEAEADMESKQAAYKAAKAHVEELKDERDILYRKLTESIKDRPLFKDQESKPEAVKATVSDEWRDEPITVLIDHGITAKDSDKLIEGGITTLGQLADCKDLTALKGIGAKAAERIADAATSYHTSHQEQDADEPDESLPESEDEPEAEPAEADDLPRPYWVRFSVPKEKRHVVYAKDSETALHYAMDQLTYVKDVLVMDEKSVEDDDVIAHVPEGYGIDSLADASAGDGPEDYDDAEDDGLTYEPDPDTESESDE